MLRSVEQEHHIRSMELASCRHGLRRRDEREDGEEDGEEDGKDDGKDDCKGP